MLCTGPGSRASGADSPTQLRTPSTSRKRTGRGSVGRWLAGAAGASVSSSSRPSRDPQLGHSSGPSSAAPHSGQAILERTNCGLQF